jgi:glycosyltransferase involved in cell wall biosynthesis
MGRLFDEKRYNMVTISIASLIYKSEKYADWVHDSIHEFTPQLKRGEAEFFFVANDPTEELLAHLQKKGYKHYVNRNPMLTEEELFGMGYGAPLHIHRVYRGYNKAIEVAEGEIVVLVNSDNYFSPDWLENLLKYLGSKTVVCSKLVERKHPKYAVFPGAYHCEFGSGPDDFNKEAFLRFCERARITGLQLSGAYMPCAFYKSIAIKVGLYPEGNLAGSSFNHVIATGDEVFFRKLSNAGIKHFTAIDSIVYHTKEGEMDETAASEVNLQSHELKTNQATAEDLRAQRVEPIMIRGDGDRQYLAIAGSAHIVAMKYRIKPLSRQNLPSVLAKALPKPLFKVIQRVWHRIRPILSKG